MTQEDIIKKLTDALKVYADSKSWVRGIIFGRQFKYRYGFELAEETLKEIESDSE